MHGHCDLERRALRIRLYYLGHPRTILRIRPLRGVRLFLIRTIRRHRAKWQDHVSVGVSESK